MWTIESGSGCFPDAAQDALTELVGEPESCTGYEAVEEQAQCRHKVAMLSLDHDTDESRDVKTEGKHGDATGTLVNEHVGNAALQREENRGQASG